MSSENPPSLKEIKHKTVCEVSAYRNPYQPNIVACTLCEFLKVEKVSLAGFYVALRTVHATWATIKQNRNNKEICDTASELINRVGDLLERVQKMGKKLSEVNAAYGEVNDKAKKGQSVLGSAQKLVKLGAKVSTVHPLPSDEDPEIFPQLPSAE